ncbi:hypothetical protein PMI21_05689 [Pseudomonas sp. GM18]|uniref:LirA/MavJ family T4SS effector n=1 Tax=Pseudomonas sp. GM18 TaxID=1144324 RepID=UPI0002726146|nr:LirA/MavJ family T4SS effector [Pseudomonas sp. GM18]EJM09223.1 hypothetical protein PMI21_05689 [Pseudomonas sp. GM18]
MPTIETIKKEIKDNFGDHEDLNDICKIAKFLNSPNEFLAMLNLLNEDLRKRASTLVEMSEDTINTIDLNLRIDEVVANYYAKHAEYTGELKKKSKRVLEETFTTLESLNSFSIPGSRKVQILTGFASKEVFAKVTKNRLHWRDPGVFEVHGEYSHRIQWYCIVKSNVATNPASIFSLLAQTSHIDKERFPNVTLWDAIVDRNGGDATDVVPFDAEKDTITLEDSAWDGNALDKKLKNSLGPIKCDFRSPEILHNFILQASKFAPTASYVEPLASIIKAKMEVHREAIRIDKSNWKKYKGKDEVAKENLRRQAAITALLKRKLKKDEVPENEWDEKIAQALSRHYFHNME